ncbi:hypothetical protein [Saccharopolyspora taberi]|uniref:Uncharacterized protein n=1 Tax=Saccharopolyspora taberi TaxID=60895 RepID=A0ABN3VC42_9PSEU
MKSLWRRAMVGIAVAVPAFLAIEPVASARLSLNHNETVLQPQQEESP